MMNFRLSVQGSEQEEIGPSIGTRKAPSENGPRSIPNSAARGRLSGSFPN